MTRNGDEPRTWGFLAFIKLQAAAAFDDRLKNWHRRYFILLGHHIDPKDGTCCVSLSHLAEKVGKTRQTLQNAVTHLIRCGYVKRELRFRKSGAHGANVYTFPLDLDGACPVVWPQEVQTIESAEECRPQGLQGVQARESAHKKPSTETNLEETNSESSRAIHGNCLEDAKIQSYLQDEKSSREKSLVRPYSRKGRQVNSDAGLCRRIDLFNRGQERAASGRLWMTCSPRSSSILG